MFLVVLTYPVSAGLPYTCSIRWPSRSPLGRSPTRKTSSGDFWLNLYSGVPLWSARHFIACGRPGASTSGCAAVVAGAAGEWSVTGCGLGVLTGAPASSAELRAVISGGRDEATTPERSGRYQFQAGPSR